MLRMSKLADYGALVMAYLARSDRMLNVSEISSEIKVASPTVAKLLKLLTRGDLLVSHRGVNGGYSLARSADDISVADIIDVIEGPIALTECVSQPGSCVQESDCSLRENWQVINDAMRKALSEVSVSDLAAGRRQHSVAIDSIDSKGSFDTTAGGCC